MKNGGRPLHHLDNFSPPKSKTPMPRSFSELRDCIAVDSNSGWTDKYKKVVISDMTRLIALDPAVAAMQPTGRVIVPRFRSLTPLTTQLSQSRINNIRTSCRAAFLYAGHHWKGMRGLHALMPAWQSVWALIQGDRNCTMYLSKFSHWCSGAEIEPAQVNAVVLERYQAYLEQVVGKADGAVQKMVRRWNQCAEGVDGWPKIPLTAPRDHRKKLATPVNEMGKLLRKDFYDYVELMRSGSQAEDSDPFHCEEDEKDDAETGRTPGHGQRIKHMKPYADTTINGRMDVIRRLIGLCSRATNISLEELRLADLVTKKNASLTLKLYRKELGNDTADALVNGAHALVVLARYFVRVDSGTQAKLDEFAANILARQKRVVKARTGGMTRKNRERLQQLGPKQMAALLRLPAMLIAPVLARVRAGTASPADLVDTEVAAAITILFHAPLRSRNTVSIKVGRHLILPPGPGPARLLFPYSEVKNDVDLEFILPPDAVRLLRVYFEEIRPHFDRTRRSNFLFPGLVNDTKSANHLGRQILERIRSAIGVTLNQHLFRHLVALLYLRRCPGQYEVVRIFLGHKSVATTRKYYCGLEAEAALAHLQEVMAMLKSEAGVDPGDMTRLRGLSKRVRPTRRAVAKPRNNEP